MKKILSAAIVAAMVSTVAFAEVTVSQNVRVRPNLYKMETPKDGDDKVTFADLDGYAKANDTLKIAGKTDYAGVTAEITLDASNTGTFAIDNYYGWVNWGALKFTAGIYDSRFTNRGNYSATEQGILDEEFSKAMGISSKNGAGDVKVDGTNKIGPQTYLQDFGNVAQVNGGNNLSFLVDYTFEDVAGGSLLLKAGLVENAANAEKDSKPDNKLPSKTPFDETDTFTQSAGWVAEAAWSKKDVANVDLIFKKPTSDALGLGIYVTPLMIANTKNVVVGFTYGTVEDVGNAWALDLRGTYNINDAATVAIGAKYESIEPEDMDAETAMQVAGEFSYVVNDLFTVAADVGYFATDLDDNDGEDKGEDKLVLGLRGKFTAGKNAAITTGINYNMVMNDGDMADDKTVSTLTIPVVMRVKM